MASRYSGSWPVTLSCKGLVNRAKNQWNTWFAAGEPAATSAKRLTVSVRTRQQGDAVGGAQEPGQQAAGAGPAANTTGGRTAPRPKRQCLTDIDCPAHAYCTSGMACEACADPAEGITSACALYDDHHLGASACLARCGCRDSRSSTAPTDFTLGNDTRPVPCPGQQRERYYFPGGWVGVGIFLIPLRPTTRAEGPHRIGHTRAEQPNGIELPAAHVLLYGTFAGLAPACGHLVFGPSIKRACPVTCAVCTPDAPESGGAAGQQQQQQQQQQQGAADAAPPAASSPAPAPASSATLEQAEVALLVTLLVLAVALAVVVAAVFARQAGGQVQDSSNECTACAGAFRFREFVGLSTRTPHGTYGRGGNRQATSG